jgi:hypothetical protein
MKIRNFLIVIIVIIVGNVMLAFGEESTHDDKEEISTTEMDNSTEMTTSQIGNTTVVKRFTSEYSLVPPANVKSQIAKISGSSTQKAVA